MTASHGAGEPGPCGGVSTGFGGTGPHGRGSALPWLVAIGAGLVLAPTGGLKLHRGRRAGAGI